MPNGFHCYYKSEQIYYKVGQLLLLQIRAKDIANWGRFITKQSEGDQLQVGVAITNRSNYYESAQNDLLFPCYERKNLRNQTMVLEAVSFPWLFREN